MLLSQDVLTPLGVFPGGGVVQLTVSATVAALTNLIVEGRASLYSPWQRIAGTKLDYQTGNNLLGVVISGNYDDASKLPAGQYATLYVDASRFSDIRALASGQPGANAVAVVNIPGSASNRVHAIIGDSITEQNTYNTAVFKAFRAIGYASWARFYSWGSIDIPLPLNLGVGGNTSVLVVARLPSTLAAIRAAGATSCSVMVGTNDALVGVTLAQYIQNCTTIFESLSSLGLRVLVLSVIPRAGLSAPTDLTQAVRQQMGAQNAWLAQYCRGRAGFSFVDSTSHLVDYTATGTSLGDPIGGNSAAATAVTYDGTHLQRLGASAVGANVATALAVWFPPTSAGFGNPADIISATNPYGNILTNGNLVGTTGTLSNSAGGTAPTGWTLQALTGGALVQGSIGTMQNGPGAASPAVPCTVVTLGAGACSFKLYQQKFAAGLATQGVAVGDLVYAECACEVTGGVGITSLVLNVADGTMTAEDMSGTGQGYMPASFRGLLKTPPFVLASTAVVTTQVTGVVATGSGAAVVKLGLMALRKVAPVN